MMKQLFTAFLAVLMMNGLAALAEAREIRVVTTIGMITDAVEAIGGDKVVVQGLMGAGVDPHLYKATESDVNKLARADIIFYNGLYLEAKMEKIFKQMQRSAKTVAISEGLDTTLLLESEDYPGHYDPHVWFDVPLWSGSVARITETLAEYDPENAAYYRERSGEYLEQLRQLHVYLTRRSVEVGEDQRVLITAHDAFRYFGRKYGFEVRGLQGLSTESEAGTRDVMELADFIAKRKIKAIFVESSVPERNIRAVQDAVRAKGWNVIIGGELFSDAMGTAGTVEGTYTGMVTHNIDTIVDALK